MAEGQREWVGQRIGGRYRIVEPLGVGGMGRVFRVETERGDTPLALKLQGGVGRVKDSRIAALRFQREFHTLAGLRHPRVVEVYDFGHDDTHGPYYTMELLDGKDLNEVAVADYRQVCSLLRDVASAIAFLHDRRLLHRDLKGRNVRCTDDGRAKLIDFGILSSFGISTEVAGTPPFVPPEGYYALPMDHRCDLYGLGALAYKLLTGRHAYPAARIDDLPKLWAEPLPKMTDLVCEIPADLEQLVMSLLSLDRFGRPSSAVEVADRLTALGDLERLDESEAARGYLASAPLIGREPQLEMLRQLQESSIEGAGSGVLIAGAAGVGKTRLLAELSVEAQLMGALVLRADCDAASSAPYSLVRRLASSLLDVMPDAATLAEPQASILHEVVPQLEALFEFKKAPPTEPAEERVRLQSALVDWFVAVARAQPLTVVVDGLQLCDETSAAVLAGLAHVAPTAPLLIVGSEQSGARRRAPAALTALSVASTEIRLRPLERSEVIAVTRALFGAAPNSEQLASWIAEASGGVPLHCVELARHLVDREVVRFVAGAWVIPEDITKRALEHSDEMPSSFEVAVEARIEALPANARAVAELLSVYGGEFSLQQVALVAGAHDPGELFGSIHQLLSGEVLAGHGEWLRFRHKGLRDALLARLEDSERERLHLLVGEALLDRASSDPALAVQVGSHLVSGGDRERGAELLEEGGRRLFETQSMVEAIDPLERALEIYVETKPVWRQLEIRAMLLLAGMVVDRATALAQIKAIKEGYASYTGMGAAVKLSRVVGRPLGLALGLLGALTRWAVLWPVKRGPRPTDVLPTFFISLGAASNMFALSLDIESARDLEKSLEPVAVLKNRVPNGAYLATKQHRVYAEGRLMVLKQIAARALEIFTNDKKTPIPEIDRLVAISGERFWLLLVAVVEQSSDFQSQLDELEQVGFVRARLLANLIRVIHYRFRGEEDIAQEIERELDVLYVRLGPLWFGSAVLSMFATIAYGIVGDVLGLKRSIQQLATKVADGYHMQSFHDLAVGEYNRLLGRLDEAEASLRKVIDSGRDDLAAAIAPAALADTLVAAGRFDEAREQARRAIEINSSADRAFLLVRLRAEATLAIADAASGQLETATARLDEAIAGLDAWVSPAIRGVLHEARARVALFADNEGDFESHLRQASEWFGPTRNPALVMRAERLSRANPFRQERDHMVSAVEALTFSSRAELVTELSAVWARDTRAERILATLVTETGATHGFLFAASDPADVELIAPKKTSARPDLVDAVRESIRTRSRKDGPTVQSSPHSRNRQRVFLLELPEPDTVVGAVVLVPGEQPLDEPARDLLALLGEVMRATEAETSIL